MKKTTTSIILILLCFFIKTSFGQEVVSTQGDSYSNVFGSIDFTIGEAIINTVSDGTHTLTQGFHQSKWSVVGITEHLPDYDANVFPNPTEDILNIQASKFEEVSYLLYDVQGKLIKENKLNAGNTVLYLSEIAAGRYTLILTKNYQKLKTFKLIKH
jgi:hypothetical protein